MIHCFLGYDERQTVAYTVAAQSILEHATAPVAIHPLVLRTLPITRRGLTDFTYSRFLVPWLCGYEGWAIFMDADVLVRGDVKELLEAAEQAAVSVVFHAERPYENASVMVFNNELCKTLTPEYVETAKNPLKLDWASSIGKLPKEWNHLVNYNPPNPSAKLAHFTQGIPCFPETQSVEFADEWHKVATQCMTTVSWDAMMGNSVHRQFVKPT